MLLSKEARKAFTFKRIRILFARPSIITFVMVVIWRRLVVPYISHWFHHLDIEVTASTLATAAVFHAILAAWVLSNALAGRQRMYECLETRNFVRFVQYRDERIFWPLHLLLVCFSIMMVVGAMMVSYQSLASGYYVLIAVTMMVTVYWEVAMVADDPLNSRWYEDDDHISSDCRTMDLSRARAIMEHERGVAELFEKSSIQQRLLYGPEDQILMKQFLSRCKL